MNPPGSNPVADYVALVNHLHAVENQSDYIHCLADRLWKSMSPDQMQAAKEACETIRDQNGIPDDSRAVEMSYQNYRHEIRQRVVTPIGPIYWASNEWHPEPQWLLDVFDHEKREVRTFALRGILGVLQAERDNGRLVTGEGD